MTINGIQTGDILLITIESLVGKQIYSKIGNFLEFIIGGKYIHSALYYGKIYNRDYIIDSIYDGVRLRPLKYKKWEYDTFEVLHSLNEYEIQRKMIELDGTFYDYAGLIGIILKRLGLTKLNIFQNPKLLICFEFVNEIHNHLYINNSIVTPNEMVKHKYLKRRQ